MTRRDDISDPNPLTGQSNQPETGQPDSMDQSRMMDDGRAAAREAEVCQRTEIEIAFRNRLIASLDKEGCIVKENGATTDERVRLSLWEKYENEPAQTSSLWTLFFVHSKDASAAFCLSVWFSSDEPSPRSFKWRVLDGDGMSVAGPSKCKKWDGISWCDATPPLCYHLSIIDARLRFEALPLPVMRDALIDGHLAEELASKVAIAFAHISALNAN
jgi:hypothetical protein